MNKEDEKIVERTFKKSSQKIGYGDEKLYCPVCRGVLIRGTNPELSNFRCIPCGVDWMITDSKGFYVLSPMMNSSRDRITMAERGLRTKNDNIRIEERSKTAKAIFADFEKAGFVLNTDEEYVELYNKYCDEK